MYKQLEIEDWARAKGIYDYGGNFVAQMKGIAEEAVEATEAWTVIKYMNIPLDLDRNNLEKELGDIYVWWINSCAIAGVRPEDAVDAAYNKIMKRTGKMENGRFIKDD